MKAEMAVAANRIMRFFLALAFVLLAGCAPAPPPPTGTPAPPPTLTATTTAIIVMTPRTATITPTPRPIADPLWQQQGDLTLYHKDDNLCLVAGGETPVYLADAARISWAGLSPDGRVIAYVRTLADDWGPGGYLGLMPFEVRAIDADGSHDRLLLSSDKLDLSPLLQEKKDARYAIIQIAWVPGTHRLIFSTFQLIQAYTYALHSLDADTGIHRVRLDTGSGGIFTISPDGRRIAVVQWQSIGMMDTSGENWQPDVFPYHFLMTYSDSPGFLDPVWAPDSSGLRVAVPPFDPLGEDTTVRTWFIPADGEPPYRLATIDGLRISYFGAAAISPDGEYLVALTMSRQSTDYQLHVMRADGSADRLIDAGVVEFDRWEADSRHFLVRAVGPPFDVFRGSVDGGYELVAPPDIPDQGCAVPLSSPTPGTPAAQPAALPTSTITAAPLAT